MDNELVQHLLDIKGELAAVSEKTSNIEASLPPLAERVSKLEAGSNKMKGALAVVTGLGGIAEWLLHWHKH